MITGCLWYNIGQIVGDASKFEEDELKGLWYNIGQIVGGTAPYLDPKKASCFLSRSLPDTGSETVKKKQLLFSCNFF